MTFGHFGLPKEQKNAVHLEAKTYSREPENPHDYQKEAREEKHCAFDLRASDEKLERAPGSDEHAHAG